MADKSIRQTKRRSVLKQVGVAGSSAVALPTLSGLVAGQNSNNKDVRRIWAYRHTNHEEVVKGVTHPKRKPVTETITFDDWVRIESTDDARERLKHRLHERFDIPIQVGMRTDRIDETAELVVRYPDIEAVPESAPRMQAPSFNEVKSAVPSAVSGVAGRGSRRAVTVDGIPVRTERSSVAYLSAEYFDYQYRPVPAGAAWTMTEDEPDSYCTTATPATDDNDGEPVIVTAAHCFVIPNSTNFWQYDPTGTSDGNLKDGLFAADFDAALVEPNSFNNVEHDFASNSGSNYRNIEIWGVQTRQAITDMQDRGDSLEKQGATTGIDSAEIVEVADREFATEHDADHGDSGGSVYKSYHFNGVGWYAYVGGVISRQDQDDSDIVWHTLMESVEDELEITV